MGGVSFPPAWALALASLSITATGLLKSEPDALPGSISLHNKTSNANYTRGAQSYRQQLSNDGDVLYTLVATIGGQRVDAIPDSGSFELLVFSKECFTCNVQHAYDHTGSKTYATQNFQSKQNFGSGSAKSVEAYEKLRVGPMARESQVFWRVVDADAGFTDMDFGAILGVGPPASIRKMAERDRQSIEDQVSTLQKEGQDVEPYVQVVSHYDQVAEHAKRHRSLTQATGMQSYSICLRPTSGSSGTWVWHDDLPSKMPSLFTKVPALNGVYWSASLRDARLHGGTSGTTSVSIGCGDSPCDGVVDTGTSLLVIPSDAYVKLSAAVEKLSRKKSGCDLSFMPSLKFQLGAMDIELPPESYVGSLHGSMAEKFRELMPHIWKQRQAGEDSCTLLAMTVDETSQHGPVWILGLPFFRNYYVNFHLNSESVEQSSMNLALKDRDCHPLSAASSLAREGIHGQKMLEVNAAKLRVPQWIENKVTNARERLARIA